jgi:hypothetical protein
MGEMRQEGIQNRYYVERFDGKTDPEDCRYFVLRIDGDEVEREWVLAVANAAEVQGFHALADDLRAAIGSIRLRLAEGSE